MTPSVLVSALGVVSGLLVLTSARRPRLALSVALEFWTAAGLLRLSSLSTWQSLAGAATIIVIRTVVSRAL